MQQQVMALGQQNATLAENVKSVLNIPTDIMEDLVDMQDPLRTNDTALDEATDPTSQYPFSLGPAHMTALPKNPQPLIAAPQSPLLEGAHIPYILNPINPKP